MRRPVFTIHADHSVEASTHKGAHSATDGALDVSSESELARLASQWPAKRLVEIWNHLPNVNRVTRFTDRRTAVRRIWAKIQELKPPPQPAPTTKAERIVALLKGPTGASLQALMHLTGWQSHSVRGFLSAQVSKRMGLKIRSFKRNGERIYQIRP